MHWFLDPIVNHYKDFKGRATRQEFWMFTLLYVAITLVCTLVLYVSLFSDSLFVVTTILFVIFGLAVIIPSIAITVRRLHDIGKSGWWWFLNFIPYVGGLIVIVLCCLPSQKGTNAYGANKLEPEISSSPMPEEVQNVL